MNPVVDDPEPLPPEPPGDNECCESGCERCVWTVHAEAMDAWRAAHAEWKLRELERELQADE